MTNLLDGSGVEQERPGAALGPLGRLPFSSLMVRRHGGLREEPGFLGAVVEALLTGATDSPLYPWERLPLLILVDGGRVLVTGGNGPVDSGSFPVDEPGQKDAQPVAVPLPLVATAHYRLHEDALRAYARTDAHHTATLLYLGTAPLTDGETPVLAVTGSFEDYLDLGQSPLNLQGFDQQEQSVPEVLAAQTRGTWVSIRDYAAYGYEGQGDAFAWGEPLAAAASLTNWHRTHRFDPATGTPTRAIRGGWARVTESSSELFPRTDPAVITAVTATVGRQEKILLGQARAWGLGRYSTFAGFVEGGESLENAVLREVWEECGGQVDALTYLGSQPWPFPRSLMCGYLANISNPDAVQPDGAEIENIRWFTREELLAAHTSREVQLPGKSSISRRLIEHWLGHPLDS